MSGFMPIRYSSGNISGSGGVVTKAKLWASIIGCFHLNQRAHVRGEQHCFVLCYDIDAFVVRHCKDANITAPV